MRYFIDNYRPVVDKQDDLTYLQPCEYIIVEQDKKILFSKNYTLGTGIYGFIHGTLYDTLDIKTVIEILNPVILDTDEKYKFFFNIKFWLQDMIETIIHNKRQKHYELLLVQDNIEATIDLIMPESKQIKIAINEFINEYENICCKTVIKQPINYLLDTNYDGVYIDCSIGRQLNTQSVKFEYIEIVKTGWCC